MLSKKPCSYVRILQMADPEKDGLKLNLQGLEHRQPFASNG